MFAQRSICCVSYAADFATNNKMIVSVYKPARSSDNQVIFSTILAVLLVWWTHLKSRYLGLESSD